MPLGPGDETTREVRRKWKRIEVSGAVVLAACQRELGTHLCRALLDFLPFFGREVLGKELLAIVLPPTPRLGWPEPAHQSSQTEIRRSGEPELPFRPRSDPWR